MNAAAVRDRAEVLSNRREGAYRRVTLASPRLAATAAPGQFVEVLAEPGAARLLPRPFSIHAADPAAGVVEVVFDVVGPATSLLAGCRCGVPVEVVGPLGRPFTLPAEPRRCLLVGGGYGSAPLFFLAAALAAAGSRADLLLGAATAARVFRGAPGSAGRRAASSVTVTTEDGSAGLRGLVTAALATVAARHRSELVYACGPMAMLAAVARAAAGAGLPCEVAVEERMGCGTGVCFSCVVPIRAGAGAVSRPARSCLEGPVFDGRAVAWAELGHGPDREEELVP